MTHLTDTEIVDLVEGRLAPLRAAHVDGCHACREQVDVLRDALQRAAAIDVPEPSPLFWDHFAANVRERVRTVEPSPAWWPSWLWGRAGAWTCVAAAAILVLVVATARNPVQHAPQAPAAPSSVASGVTAAASDATADDDDAWALVRTVADDASWDDTREAGIAVRPGSVDRLVLDLSPDERAELARLLREELKG